MVKAETGAQAVSRIGQDPHFDAILIDVDLPDGSGFELAARLRDAGARAPMIALAPYASREIIARRRSGGHGGGGREIPAQPDARSHPRLHRATTACGRASHLPRESPHEFRAFPHVERNAARAANALDGYFSIKVADDIFGLPVTRVQTIFRIGAVTRAPGGPRDIVGLVNLRGKIVTAVSLRRRLGLAPEAGGPGSLAIGIEHRNEAFALLVDEVGDVLTLAAETAIASPPHIGARPGEIRLRL